MQYARDSAGLGTSFFSAAIVIVVLALSGQGYSQTGRLRKAGPGGKSLYRIIEVNTGKIIRSKYEFTYEDIMHPDLAWMRKTEQLDKVVAGAKTEFEMIQRLAAWTAKQWMYGGRHARKNVPGVKVIADLHQGLGQGQSCGMFCTVFMDACHSFGIQTRALSIGSDVIRNPKTKKEKRHWHAVADVWSNDHQKWVFVDGNFACYFEDYDGTPQSIFELQKANLSGKADEIRHVYVGEFAASTAPIFRKHKNFKDIVVDIYRKLRIFRHMDMLMANNLLYPGWHSSVLGPNGEKLGPKRVYYLPPVKDFKPFFWKLQHYEKTRELNDVNWNLNEIEIAFDAKGGTVAGPSVPLTFRTFAPYLDRFLVRVNGTRWIPLKPDSSKGHDATLQYVWQLRPGLNTFEVRVRNRQGRLGVVRGIRVSDHPLSVPPRFEFSQRGFAQSGAGSVYVRAKDGSVWANTTRRGIGQLKGRKLARTVEFKLPKSETLGISKFAMDAAGRFYIAGEHAIYQCDPKGNILRTLASEGKAGKAFKSIGGLAVGPKGNLYVSEADMGRLARIQVLDPRGRLVRTFGKYGQKPGELNLPAEIAVDPSGRVFVADSGNHRVQVFDAGDKLRKQIGPQIDGYGTLRFPSGIAVANQGGKQVVYIVDTFNHRIVIVDSEGRLLGSFGGYSPTHEKGKFLQPRSIAVGGKAVYVLEPPYLHAFTKRP